VVASAGAGPSRGTLVGGELDWWRRGDGSEQESVARERGPENAGDASALPQPPGHAGLSNDVSSCSHAPVTPVDASIGSFVDAMRTRINTVRDAAAAID
jgi:hypothetical protein